MGKRLAAEERREKERRWRDGEVARTTLNVETKSTSKEARKSAEKSGRNRKAS